jgi:hypothetical protein
VAGIETDVRALVVERLCEHHDVSAFKCGNAVYDLLIADAQRTSKFGAEKDAWFVLHHGDNRVLGFICIGPGQFQGAAAIWVSALATDLSVRSSARPVTALIRKFRQVANALRTQPSHLRGAYEYEAVVISPSGRIEAGLQRAGFLKIDESIWCRRAQ